MNRLAHQIRHFRADVYTTFPDSVRALHALVRISAHAEGRKKKAYSANTITKLIDSELRKKKVEAPAINWGLLFTKATYKTLRKYNLDKQTREDFLADLVSDVIMGQSITTIRDTGPWKRNLVEQLEEWVKAGWGDDRIKATLSKWLNDKMYNIWKRWDVMTHQQRDIAFEKGTPGDDYQGSAVFEGLFSMDGLSSDQMGSYHSILRQNPNVKNLVEKIEKVLSRKDDDMGLIWQAYTSDPDASMQDLLKVPVRLRGERMPLETALGLDPEKNNKQNLYNRVKKLRALLRRLWPDIDATLRDIMYA